jgi:hypothetical protein
MMMMMIIAHVVECTLCLLGSCKKLSQEKSWKLNIECFDVPKFEVLFENSLRLNKELVHKRTRGAYYVIQALWQKKNWQFFSKVNKFLKNPC